jgi:hypothetical protein
MAKTPKPPALTVVSPDAIDIQPPRKLGRRGMELWLSVSREFVVDDAAGIQMLLQCCLALDRLEALGEQISRDGEVIRAREASGHIERRSRAALIRLQNAAADGFKLRTVAVGSGTPARRVQCLAAAKP